ncbi:MAG: aminopeptidase P family protein [Opitutaceae bacterium]|nr:aminopeptidase P family protein [Opitutaceae bacterium]
MSSRKSPKKITSASLLYADTLTSPDQLYLGRFFVPDPFISFLLKKKKVGVFNALEFSRALKESLFDEVLSLEEWTEKAHTYFGRENIGIPEVIYLLARSYKLKTFRIPFDFPTGVAFELLELGLKVNPVEGHFFPEREVKTEEEARFIIHGNRCSALGFKVAEELLSSAKVKRGKLYHGGRVLTSQRVQQKIEVACLKAGAISADTIVAGGDQACDPHCRGSGPLFANQLIIVDIFPRVTQTGYFGDMTRTFLKGKASEAQTKLVRTVRAAQKIAIQTIKAGISGQTVHSRVVDHFTSEGYQTQRGEGGAIGFFHGTGHGLGLAVHEAPRLSVKGGRLRKGAVVTVEPGLYYPGLGGCRIEDVVQVTNEGVRMLSHYPYRWQIT